jgi:predicted amidohydrolase
MLKIAAIQFDIIWEDAAANREYLEPLIKKHHGSDLIILPEMFNAGFTTNVDKAAEAAEGPTAQWMRALCKELDCAICGSIPTKVSNKYFNRFYWVDAHRFLHYDKKHLFGYGKESEVYSAGDRILIVDYKGWKIKPLICYDLRFPVWSRNTENYDLLLYVANWPNTRASAWRQLLRARAIENLCFVCGVNRIGVDGLGLKYIGDSAIIDYMGEDIISSTDVEQVITCTLEKSKMNSFREQFNFLNDRDAFTLV